MRNITRNIRLYTFKRNNTIYETLEREFNYNNLLISEERYKGESPKYIDGFLEGIFKYFMYECVEYEYDNNRYQLTQTRTKKYTVPESGGYGSQDPNDYLLIVEDYEYDQYGNLIKYWGPDAARDSNNELINPQSSNYLVKYTYDTSRYHLMTQKEYKRCKYNKGNKHAHFKR